MRMESWGPLAEGLFNMGCGPLFPGQDRQMGEQGEEEGLSPTLSPEGVHPVGMWLNQTLH